MRKCFLLLTGIIGSAFAIYMLLYNVWAAPSNNLTTDIYQRGEPGTVKMRVSGLNLPYLIPGTELIIKEVASYDGPYVEDYSDEEVVNVAALVLHNQGPEEVKTVQILLNWKGGTYVFDGNMIPAGETVLILEKERQCYGAYRWTNCSCSQTVNLEERSAYEYVTVRETGMGKILVKNISEQLLSDIRVYYKNYLSPPGIHVGGVVYCAGIETLLPGESVELMPWHYAQGYTRVIRISCEPGG